MAIIKPSKKFIGSEIDLRDAGKYIRPEVRQVSFNKKNNPNGAWLYFLPPYKVDAEGNGVWYKTFKIRDNFGDKFKEKYVCIENDPVDHFERNMKIHFSEEAKAIEGTDDNGQKRKVYPLFGRTTTRVVYNVAYVNNLEAGAHVLDLPSFNGASIINSWLGERDTRGRERPVLNDPDSCIPVFIKLKDGGGAPWQIEPSQSEATNIPEALADSENIYNLDDVFIRRTPAELIEKLSKMYSPDVFEKCMSGYPGFDKVVINAEPAPARVAQTSKISVPSAKLSSTVPAVANLAKPRLSVEEEVVETEFIEDDGDEIPGIAVSKPKVTAEQAAAFLKRPKPRITSAEE
jgi:hypothetical protein